MNSAVEPKTLVGGRPALRGESGVRLPGPRCTITEGHVLDVLRSMPDESIHCCVTSPPYYGLRAYGTEPQLWGDGWRGELGAEPDYRLYVAHLVEVFREVRRVLREDGTLWLNLGDSFARDAAKGQHKPGDSGKQAYVYDRGGGRASATVDLNQKGLKAKDLIGIPWRAAFALQDDGWYLRMDNIWAKPNCMPESVTDRCTKSHEYVFLLAKSKRYYYDADAIMEPLTTAESENYPARARATGRADQGYAVARGNDRGKSGGFPPRKLVSRYNFARDTKEGDVPGANNKQHRGDRAPTFRPEARNKRSVWFVNTTPFAGAHFAVMPEEIAYTCVLAGCPKGGTVLDTFCGSGTVGVVALRHDREFRGIELNPKYLRMAHRRIVRDAPMRNAMPPGLEISEMDGLPLFERTATA